MKSDEGYELIDSGFERRLDRFGPYILDRPAPQAFWKPQLSKKHWKNAHAKFERSSSGGGKWKFMKKLPERWIVKIVDFEMIISPTGFGHVGAFPEQTENLRLIQQRIKTLNRKIEVMNLFGYTGAATLAASKAGAELCHVDASKGIVKWGRDNAKQAGLTERPIRWMVEDVIKFLKREIRREHFYHGLVLDPPTFGRGNKGEVWKIESDLPELLLHCREVLHKKPDFVILSTYSPKFTPHVLGNMLDDAFGDLNGTIESTEMLLPETSRNRQMPNGVTARWLAKR